MGDKASRSHHRLAALLVAPWSPKMEMTPDLKKKHNLLCSPDSEGKLPEISNLECITDGRSGVAGFKGRHEYRKKMLDLHCRLLSWPPDLKEEEELPSPISPLGLYLRAIELDLHSLPCCRPSEWIRSSD
ncbi:hypothetical protein ACLOJK_003812 [Asimina triloba]